MGSGKFIQQCSCLNPSNNAPAYVFQLIHNFLVKHCIERTSSSASICPDTAPCNFWFFPKLKIPLKGREFGNAEDPKPKMPFQSFWQWEILGKVFPKKGPIWRGGEDFKLIGKLFFLFLNIGQIFFGWTLYLLHWMGCKNNHTYTHKNSFHKFN